jgi:hypothetical protein
MLEGKGTVLNTHSYFITLQEIEVRVDASDTVRGLAHDQAYAESPPPLADETPLTSDCRASKEVSPFFVCPQNRGLCLLGKAVKVGLPYR